MIAENPNCQEWSLQKFYIWSVQKPNSWTYNFAEVSGHNLESFQTWGFCMDFLNHREGGMVFYQVFLLSPLQCTVNEISRQICRGICEQQGGKLLIILFIFRPRIRPLVTRFIFGKVHHCWRAATYKMRMLRVLIYWQGLINYRHQSKMSSSKKIPTWLTESPVYKLWQTTAEKSLDMSIF